MTPPPLPANDNCRNCDARVAGEYCANCGQETRIELPSFRAFMRDAAGRYVALDGRLWRTLYALIAWPGFLTHEYFAGRRRRYIRPARLFLVTSVLLFAIIGLVSTPRDFGDEIVFVDSESQAGGGFGSDATKSDPAVDTKERVDTDADAAKAARRGRIAQSSKAVVDGSTRTIGLTDSERDTRIGLDKDLNLVLRVDGRDVLPETLKGRYAQFKKLSQEQKAERIYAGMVRFGPYSMVALLPAFAFLLKLTYAGSGRRYPGRPRNYAEHLVYSAHLHAFAALILALMVLIPVTPIRILLGLWIVFYVLRARQLVYQGRWWAGILRALLVAMLYTVLISLAMLGLLIAAVLLR